MKSLIIGALAASMLAVGDIAPPLSGDKTPHFKLGTTYIDGLGCRKKIPLHPKHNSRTSSYKQREFSFKVRATHSHNPDPRDGKYLNNFARRMRVLYPDQAAQELFA